MGLVSECPKGTGEQLSSIGLVYKVTCVVNTPEPDLTCAKTRKVGNPIYPATGLKEQTEIDYRGSGVNDLQFIRTYRSDRNGWAHNYQAFGIDFTTVVTPSPTAQNTTWPSAACYPGVGQSTNQPYCFNYFGHGLANDFTALRGTGRVINFGSATDLMPATDINDRLTKLSNGWRVQRADNEAVEFYDLSGRLATITSRDQRVQTLTYSDSATPTTIAPKAGLLIRVADQFGHQLNFNYDSAGRMSKMIDAGGGSFLYGYDEVSSIVVAGQTAVGNLTSVTYPDGQKRRYWYNEQDKTANTNLPFALTGITDENGVRYANYFYGSDGKAISTEHAGNVEKYSVDYGTNQVTDPLGAKRTYNFQTILGVVRSTGENQPGGSGCAPASSAITYDANANIASRTDFNGVITTYIYDLSRNLETSRIEAAGTPTARTISTQWHASYRLPLKIAEPLSITSFTYDASGNLLTRSEQATTDTTGAAAFSATATGTARIWRWTYNSFGQVLTATGPRTDLVDRTSYTYDSQGNFATSTNPVGQVTTYNQYDANGRLLKMTDANGLITTLTYSPRGWLTSSILSSAGTTATERTSYTYDPAGQLTQVTLPDTSTLRYSYDAAHRLVGIADSLGNRIDYTLDPIGNRINEQIKDASGNLSRQTSRVVDALNRIQQQTGNSYSP